MPDSIHVINILKKYSWVRLLCVNDRAVWVGPRGRMEFQEDAYRIVRDRICRRHSKHAGPPCSHWECREEWIMSGKRRCLRPATGNE